VQITAAAEVSSKTFFAYFESKADVLFVDPLARVDAAIEAITQRRSGEPVATVLARAVELMLTTAQGRDPRSGLLRQRLIASVPSARSRALHHVLAVQDRLAVALHTAYPEEFDEAAAAAITGQLLGAVLGALQASARRGDSVPEMLTAVRQATARVLATVAAATPAQES
jgi:AcrR family transcriptional regulator